MALDPVTAILNVGNSLIDKLLPDKQANDKAKADLLQMQVAGELAQIQGQLEVDKTEAANTNVFVAGWRPFCGWIAGTGLAVQFLVAPFATWIAALCGHPIVFPSLDMGTLMTLLLGMLGLGGMRTFEKVSGIKDDHPLK
jgi:hypothetical protein